MPRAVEAQALQPGTAREPRAAAQAQRARAAQMPEAAKARAWRPRAAPTPQAGAERMRRRDPATRRLMPAAAFIALEKLPLTPNGKVDRQALPPPGEGRPEVGEEFVAPRTAEETLLAGIIGEGQHSGVFRRNLDPRVGAWELIRTALGYTLTLPLGLPLYAEPNYLPAAIECLLHCLLKTDI